MHRWDSDWKEDVKGAIVILSIVGFLFGLIALKLLGLISITWLIATLPIWGIVILIGGLAVVVVTLPIVIVMWYLYLIGTFLEWVLR